MAEEIRALRQRIAAEGHDRDEEVLDLRQRLAAAAARAQESVGREAKRALEAAEERALAAEADAAQLRANISEIEAGRSRGRALRRGGRESGAGKGGEEEFFLFLLFLSVFFLRSPTNPAPPRTLRETQERARARRFLSHVSHRTIRVSPSFAFQTNPTGGVVSTTSQRRRGRRALFLLGDCGGDARGRVTRRGHGGGGEASRRGGGRRGHGGRHRRSRRRRGAADGRYGRDGSVTRANSVIHFFFFFCLRTYVHRTCRGCENRHP